MHKGHTITQVLKKWGRAKQRPQDNSRDLLEHRRKINTHIFPLIHPYSATIRNWEISQDMLSKSAIRPSPEYILVDTVEVLSELSTKLKTERVLSVDTESSSFESFVHMTCLLEISTPEKDYVIDTLALCDKINFYLREVLESPQQLKIVQGNMQVRAIQRDFNIYSTGVIDLQEVYFKIYGQFRQVSLGYMANKLLKNDILEHSFTHLADWRIRPLPKELIEYAALDSRFILRCWEKMITDHQTKILSMNFEISKTFTERVYRFPESQEPLKLWNNYVKSLKPDFKKVFKTVGQRELFLELANLVITQAKTVDSPINYVMQGKTIGLLCRCMPKTAEDIFKIMLHYYTECGGLVSKDLRTKLATIISEHSKEMHSYENAKLIIDPPKIKSATNKQVHVRPLTRSEAMELEITQEELDSQSDVTNSEYELDYDSKAINDDLLQWNKVLESNNVVKNVNEGIENECQIVNEVQSKKKKKLVKISRVNRAGKLFKVKRVFYLAARLGLCKEDIEVNLPKFPEFVSKRKINMKDE